MRQLTPVVHPVYEIPGGSPAPGDLRTRLVMERSGDDFMESHGEITNDRDVPVTLHIVNLLEAGLLAGWKPGERERREAGWKRKNRGTGGFARTLP